MQRIQRIHTTDRRRPCLPPFSQVKCLMRQLLSGVAYLHSHWVLHRDLKTSNILYTNRSAAACSGRPAGQAAAQQD